MKVFQPFRLDTVNHCLWHADKRVNLTPKAFDVLRYLVEHFDRLVTQDEILEALWPGTYVNPEVVKKYVLGIRKALGDRSQQPQFVATFPKRGYQFIAPVSDESPASFSRHSENTVKNIVGRHHASVQLDDLLHKAIDGHPIAYGETIDQMAAGYLALYAGKYRQAIDHFRNVCEPAIPTKFFLHWWYRLIARLESINVCLWSGNVPSARAAAKDFFLLALSTADPYLQALAWDLKARLAMAESDWHGARESIQQSFAIVEKFEILVPAWQVYSTAWQLHLHLKEHQQAAADRERAASCILKIADSFPLEEPLRATFLAAAPVRRVLQDQTPKKSSRQAQGNYRVSAK